VRRAARVLDGRYVLQEAPIAHLGPGRPLGFEFDAAGDLIVCVAGAVRSPALLRTLPFPPALHGAARSPCACTLLHASCMDSCRSEPVVERPA
jgi:hypothetical protein